MNLGAFLIVLGLVVAFLFHWSLGLLLILVGVVLVALPLVSR